MEEPNFFKENKIFIAIIVAGFTIGGSIYFAAKLSRPAIEDPAAGEPVVSQASSSEIFLSEEKNGSSFAAVQVEVPPAAVGQNGNCVSYADAGNFIGENKCIFGKVDNVYTSSGGTTFLDFCPDYKTCPFSAVIFKSDSAKFPDPKQYQGKAIEITGLVKTYQGRPEIILNDASQIKIK